MVRLNLEGIWIDLNDQEFELKWKHPIQNSLKGENSTYSTDITCALTENNRLAFDYKIFTSSSKANRYSYGVLYVNNTAMRVRCYIRQLLPSSVKFYLEQFRSGGVSTLLKDTKYICNIHLQEIQNQSKRDVLLNIQDAARINYNYLPGVDLPNIFHGVSTNYIDSNGVTQSRPNVYAENLIQELASFYGCTLNNAPDNYYVYANQWKQRTGIFAFAPQVDVYLSTGGTNAHYVDLSLGITTPKYNLYIENEKITSTAPFKIFLKLKRHVIRDYSSIFGLKNSSGVVTEIGRVDNWDSPDPDGYFRIESPIIPIGEYVLQAFVSVSIQIYVSAEAVVCYTDEELADKNFSDYSDFALAGYYPCWQNLPAVTAKTLIETIALCSGKMVEYLDDVINFIDLDQVFSWANAIDVSDKLISWSFKEFQFLKSNNATVSYSSGKVIASVLINDETLPTETNNVATIDAIRIQDDTDEERVKDKVVLQQTPTGHFEIIDKLADIYAPTLNPKVFSAEFIYFADNKKPLLIRQLGGIFIALESVMTTKNTITLKLLKLR